MLVTGCIGRHRNEQPRNRFSWLLPCCIINTAIYYYWHYDLQLAGDMSKMHSYRHPESAVKTQSKNSETKQKILVKIWRPVAASLEKALEKCFLSRDNFLSAVIRNEIEHLDKEVATPNSSEARAFIAKQLIDLDSVPMTLRLDAAVVQRVNDVCERKRIPRDAFFNRLFWFVVMPLDAWERFILCEKLKDLIPRMEDHFPDRPRLVDDYVIPMKAIIELVTDPFHFYRECLQFLAEEDPESQPTLYSQYFHESKASPGFLGLNCYLSDNLVPTTEAGAEFLKFQSEVLEQF